ncbi:hypothetical protein yaldo0001_23070 [Yersinia aldovae ATCC 35236]|nr:hypothetical protein yaldo0001_23070 [Yersinia aldovae ATCC 35236]
MLNTDYRHGDSQFSGLRYPLLLVKLSSKCTSKLWPGSFTAAVYMKK